MLVEDDELEAVAIESQPDDRHRQLRAARADRRALPRQPLLPHARRPRRPGRLRRHPRRHARQGHGGAGPRRAGEARAGHHAAALGQGAARHHAALRLRGPRCRQLLRRSAGRQRARGHAELAEHILDSKAATSSPRSSHDRYEEAVVAMLQTKQAGMAVQKGEPATDKEQRHRPHGSAEAELSPARRSRRKRSS